MNDAPPGRPWGSLGLVYVGPEGSGGDWRVVWRRSQR